MNSILATFRSRCQEVGTANAVLLVFNRALRLIGDNFGLTRYYLLAQPVQEMSAIQRRRPGALVVRQIAADEVSLANMPRSPEEFRNRFQAGGVCLAAFRDGRPEPLGFIWLMFGPSPEPEHRCVLRPVAQPPCALDVDVYVAPEARGSTVFARLWAAANQLLCERGIQWTLSRISAYNTSSLRAHERLGARRTGSLVFLSLGGFEVLFATQRPYLAVTRMSRPAPEIVLAPPRP